jgi:Ser/Thr protein kinase RdoA (MazF antagonist)
MAGARVRRDRAKSRPQEPDGPREASGPAAASGFLALTPERVLEAVEVGGLRSTGRCLPLRAFENRVYEIELEDERRLVVKFYRPGRWSREAILDEHTFLAELAAAELPVVPPIDLGVGTTLPEIDGIFYAAFPKVRGRALDEADDERLRQIGRLIGRMHAIGAAHDAPARPRLTVERFVHEPLEVLMADGRLSAALAPRYRDAAMRIAEATAPLLARASAQRIHGDLQWGNMVWGADGPILLDFDDFLVGPPVQDIWLLARGHSEEARRARDQLLEGYELFRAFDRTTLALCEPLRALRIIHTSAWIARRWDDASFRTGFPAFGTEAYWAREYEELFAIFESL